MEKRPICQNQNCETKANLLAWGKWVCASCYLNKIDELNNSVWKE